MVTSRVRPSRGIGALPVLAVLLALCAVGAYWYFSPALAVRNMHAAVKAGDADTFNNYVDYPRLRESLKGVFNSYVAKQMEDASQAGSKVEQAGAALGGMLSMAMVGAVVDALIRPEVLMAAFQTGRLREPGGSGGSGGKTPAGEPPKKNLKWSAEHKGTDKYVVSLEDIGEEVVVLTLVFERSGFATWKLTELRPNMR